MGLVTGVHWLTCTWRGRLRQAGRPGLQCLTALSLSGLRIGGVQIFFFLIKGRGRKRISYKTGSFFTQR